MGINEAIKKQKRSYMMFMLFMCFIFFINLYAVYLSKLYNFYYFIVLFIIEVMIMITMGIKKNKDTLKFEENNIKIKITEGFPSKKVIIYYDKVLGIHVENSADDFIVFLILSPLNKGKNFTELILESEVNTEIKTLVEIIKTNKNHQKLHYYKIYKGGYIKYLLLKLLYKKTSACVSKSAIKEIKKII